MYGKVIPAFTILKLSNDLKLADVTFSRTDKTNELLYVANVSHTDICHVAEGSGLLSELTKFVESARLATVTNLQKYENGM